MKMEEIMDKYFQRQESLTKEKYEAFKEVVQLFEVPEVKPQQINIMKSNGLLEKGNVVGKISSVPIHHNVLEDVKLELNNTNADVSKVIRKYYEMQPKSIMKYGWAYKKYLTSNDSSYANLVSSRGKKIKKSRFGNLGKEVFKYGNNKGFEKVLKDVEEAIAKNHSVKRVIRKWYPNVKTSTIRTYVSLYKKHLKNITGQEPKTNSNYKYKRAPPTDTYAYNDTYVTYVLKREVNNVLSALRQVRYGYKPTVKSIAEDKDMATQRVRAVLNTLQKEEKVGYLLEEGTPTYFEKIENNHMIQ